MSNPINKKTNADKDLLKSKSVYGLPDNPSAKGFSAAQVKGKIADPSLLLFDWLKQLSEETYDGYNALVEKEVGKGLSANDFSDEYKTKLDGIASGAQVNVLEGVQVNGTDLPINNKKVNLDLSSALASFEKSVPQLQDTIAVIKSPIININGRVIDNFEATAGYVDPIHYYHITRSGSELTEEQAANYMEYLCGSRYVPTYDYEHPKNSIFLMPDGTFWKPQFQASGSWAGMFLFQLPNPFEVSSNKVTSISNASTNEQYPSAKCVYDAIAAVKKNAYKAVDTSTYSTLNDFLASTGEEGFMYLYPVDTSDLTKGYKQYIWESNAWVYMGDTNLDLTPYPTLSGNNTFSGTNTFTPTVYFQTGISVSGFVFSHLYPSSSNTYSLGLSGYGWKDLCLTNSIIFNTSGLDWTIKGDAAYNQMELYKGSALMLKISNDSIFPRNSQNLGSSTYRWKGIYLSETANEGVIDFGNDAKITKDSSNRVVVQYGGNTKAKFGGNDTYFATSVSPDSNNTYALGLSGATWKELWCKTFKGVTTISQSDYDDLVANNTVDSDTFYFIEEE